MRPYLAIIRDSFHEALASRVLWIVLVLITLFLAGLAPLGLSEQAGSYLGAGDLIDANGLLRKIRSQDAAAAPSPARRVWQLLDDRQRARFSPEPGNANPDMARFRVREELRETLNELITRRDFYDAAAWNKITLSLEARNLLARGVEKLDEVELARFNRLALEAAFPDELARVGATQLQISYLTWELGIPLPLDREQLTAVINQVLLGLMVYLLGVGGVLVAILVTAPIIPQTFEAGAIDLLLSKPISRVLLFLTKFVGGCAFIAINIVYFIGGLWLIVGLRFGQWNEKLLWCVPIFLFVFAIYYAVSALAGLLWRSAVVSVVMVIVFWAACWSLGAASNVFEVFFLHPRRVIKLIPANDTLLAVNERGETFEWTDADSSWQETFVAAGSEQRAAPFDLASGLIGPVYDAAQQRIYAIEGAPPGFPMFARESPLLVGKQADGWRRTSGVNSPAGTAALLLAPDNEIVAVSPRGVFRLQGNPEAKPRQMQLLGFQIPLTVGGDGFVEAGPTLRLRSPLAAAVDHASGELAIFDGRELVVLGAPQEKKHQVRTRRTWEKSQPGLVAFARSQLLLAHGDGKVEVYDARELQLRQTFQPEASNAPRNAIASPDGRWFGVLFHNRRLWLYDVERQAPVTAPIVGQGDISAAAFADSDRLLLADRVNRVTEYQSGTWQVQRQLRPAIPVWEQIYRYALKPAYTVLPKPGQLDQTVTYLLTDEETAPLGPREELAAGRMKLDIWGPVWSNLAFLAVVLAISCAYIKFKDF